MGGYKEEESFSLLNKNDIVSLQTNTFVSNSQAVMLLFLIGQLHSLPFFRSKDLLMILPLAAAAAVVAAAAACLLLLLLLLLLAAAACLLLLLLLAAAAAAA